MGILNISSKTSVRQTCRCRCHKSKQSSATNVLSRYVIRYSHTKIQPIECWMSKADGARVSAFYVNRWNLPTDYSCLQFPIYMRESGRIPPKSNFKLKNIVTIRSGINLLSLDRPLFHPGHEYSTHKQQIYHSVAVTPLIWISKAGSGNLATYLQFVRW